MKMKRNQHVSIIEELGWVTFSLHNPCIRKLFERMSMKLHIIAQLELSLLSYFMPSAAESSSSEEETEAEDAEKSEDEEKPKTKQVKETTYEWELLNDVKAVWLRNPKEVTDEEYNQFYHSLAKVCICILASSLVMGTLGADVENFSLQ